MNVLIIDNEDSFTYNIVDILRKFETVEYTVIQSTNVDIAVAQDFEKIIISPGPGLPGDFPVLSALLNEYKNRKSILGICLGHQAIGTFFGAGLINLPLVQHGQIKSISVKKRVNLFKGLPDRFNVGLYHSWVVDAIQFPDELSITAVSEENLIMAISHKIHDIHGVQFHPESHICEHGRKIISNFIYEKND